MVGDGEGEQHKLESEFQSCLVLQFLVVMKYLIWSKPGEGAMK